MTSIQGATGCRKEPGIKDSGQLLFKGERLAYALYCINKQYLEVTAPGRYRSHSRLFVAIDDFLKQNRGIPLTNCT